MSEELGHESLEEPPSTIPVGFTVSLRNWGDNDESAQQLASTVWFFVREFGRCFDLSSLDGVTVAGDYAQALADLDRGYPNTFALTPSEDIAVGIAMTPSVIRDGTLKSHIVLNAYLVEALVDPDAEDFRFALHTVAHECSHVDITDAFDRCFPNVLLRSQRSDLREQCRWDVILACWDEYAATRLSAGFGENPGEGYEATFVTSLSCTKGDANQAIRAYRIHGNHTGIACEVFGAYGRLMKYAAYHLGNLDGQGVTLADCAASLAALQGHWFAPFCDRFHGNLRALFETYGQWTGPEPFEALGDIAEELVALGGVAVISAGGGRVHIRVPFTPDTMP